MVIYMNRAAAMSPLKAVRKALSFQQAAEKVMLQPQTVGKDATEFSYVRL